MCSIKSTKSDFGIGRNIVIQEKVAKRIAVPLSGVAGGMSIPNPVFVKLFQQYTKNLLTTRCNFDAMTKIKIIAYIHVRIIFNLTIQSYHTCPLHFQFNYPAQLPSNII